MIPYSLALICIIISVALGIMVWYVRRLLSSIRETYSFVRAVLSNVEEYFEHLEKVYNMETFYGDSVLSGLLEHTKNLKEELNNAVRSGNDFFGDENTQSSTAPEEELAND